MLRDETQQLMGSIKALSGKRVRDDLTEPCCAAGYNRRWGVTDQAYFLLSGRYMRA